MGIIDKIKKGVKKVAGKVKDFFTKPKKKKVDYGGFSIPNKDFSAAKGEFSPQKNKLAQQQKKKSSSKKFSTPGKKISFSEFLNKGKEKVSGAFNTVKDKLSLDGNLGKNLKENIPGFFPDATIGQKLSAGLDVSLGTGFINKGAKGAKVGVSALKKTIANLTKKLETKGAAYFAEGATEVLPLTAKAAAGVFDKAAFKEGVEFAAKTLSPAANTKNAKTVMKGMKKLTKAKKYGLAVMGVFGAVYTSVAMGTHLSAQTADDTTDAVSAINFALSAAVRNEQWDEVEFLTGLLEEAEQDILESDSLMDFFNTWKAAKRKMLIDLEITKSTIRQAKEMQLQAQDAMIAEEQNTQLQLDNQQFWENYQEMANIANKEDQQFWADYAEEKSNQWLSNQKQMALLNQQIAQQEQAQWEANQETLYNYYIKKLEAEKQAFLAKQKFYQNQAPSQLGFGLL